MKILYLLRHAKAEPGGPDTSDEQRLLSTRGREACLAIGLYMKKKSYLPAQALCSPSLRTRETLTRVLEASGAQPAVRFVNTLYLASEEDILKVIRGASAEAQSVLVVGHNPGMHHVALTFASDQHTPLREELDLKYPTGALTVLRFAVDDWADIAAGAGEIMDFVTPKSL